MHNKFLLFGILVTTLLAWSCEEVAPEIEPCKTNRVVLIEEFTGVQCVNCPAGSERLGQLINQNPGKVVAISIHSGFFAKPINPTDEDFKIPEGTVIDEEVLGPVSGWPAASINRKAFNPESPNERIFGLNSWAGHISTELCYPGIADISINSNFDPTTNEAGISVSLTPNNSLPLEENVSITVMITEDNIIAPQIAPEGQVNDYNHKHVLRDILTATKGDVVANAGTQLNEYTTSFVYGIPENWEPENCHVVAFIHYSGTNNKWDVLQAAEASLVQ